MNLGNQSKIIVYYLLIREMTYFGHKYDFPLVNALICTVIYYTKFTVNYGIDY